MFHALYMLKVAITGSTGLVGSRVVELLKDDFEFLEITHDKVDITTQDSVHTFLKDRSFDFLLHSAAYTNVDKAENEEKDLCYRMNVDATKYLFEISEDKKAKFIYISTDFVFDGIVFPSYEDDVTNPLNVYGKTKLEGEKIVQEKAMIVRPSFPYRASFDKKKDFVRTIKGLLEQGKELKMVADSTNTPTFIDDLAYALKYLINNYTKEVFHINGADSMTPYEESVNIAQTFDLDMKLIDHISFEEFYKGKAPRPRHTEMKSRKNGFYRMKTFEEGLFAIKQSLS